MSSKELFDAMSRDDRDAQLRAAAADELKMKAQLPDSVRKGGVTCASPPTEGPHTHKTKEEEDMKAPLELSIKFLSAVTDRDFRQAVRLCQMILVFEPNNPEASEFLPLIQQKLLEEPGPENSTEEEEDEEEEDDDELCWRA